jgi:hypothetical protein
MGCCLLTGLHRHQAAGDVENPFDSYIRNRTALCRRPVFPKSTNKSTNKKKSVSPLACTAIERKTQPKAAWIWKIVLHPPLHPIHSYYFCSSKRLCSKGLSALTIGLAVLWWRFCA